MGGGAEGKVNEVGKNDVYLLTPSWSSMYFEHGSTISYKLIPVQLRRN